MSPFRRRRRTGPSTAAEIIALKYGPPPRTTENPDENIIGGARRRVSTVLRLRELENRASTDKGERREVVDRERGVRDRPLARRFPITARTATENY